MKYQIIIYENCRYMDDEGRSFGPEFDDVRDALEHARSIVDDDLRFLKKEGMIAEELYTHYTLYGTDPQIVSSEEVSFSGWEYAKRRCHELCGESGIRPAPAANELKYWFKIECNEAGIGLNVSPPRRDPWRAEIMWDSIVRVCFKAEGPFESDGIYIFTRERPESYAIPLEGLGGSELWQELIRRRLFDAEMAINAAAAVDQTFCWPPVEEPERY